MPQKKKKKWEKKRLRFNFTYLKMDVSSNSSDEAKMMQKKLQLAISSSNEKVPQHYLNFTSFQRSATYMYITVFKNVRQIHAVPSP